MSRFMGTDYAGRIQKSFNNKYDDEKKNSQTYVVIFYFCL